MHFSGDKRSLIDSFYDADISLQKIVSDQEMPTIVAMRGAWSDQA